MKRGKIEQLRIILFALPVYKQYCQKGEGELSRQGLEP